MILLKDIRGSFFGINHRKASANLSDLLVNILQLHVICPAELKNFFGRDVAGQGSVRSGYGMFCNAPQDFQRFSLQSGYLLASAVVSVAAFYIDVGAVSKVIRIISDMTVSSLHYYFTRIIKFQLIFS